MDYSKTIEDTIAPDQVKSLQVVLQEGQYAAVTFTKKERFSTRARLFNPNGEQEVEIEDTGAEFVVSVIAPTAGTYRIEISRIGAAGGAGLYSASVSQPRVATTEDRKRLTAERSFVQGEQLAPDRTVSGLKSRIPKYETALALWRELGDPLHETSTLMRLGGVYGDLHDADTSIAYLTEALSVSRKNGFSKLEADCAQSLGAVYTNRGEASKALDYFKEALNASREIQYKQGEAMALMSLGRNDPAADALQNFQRALELWRSTSDPRGQAYALNSLGQKYMGLGKEHEAFDSMQQSLDLARKMNDRYAEAYALQHLGDWSTMRGDLRQALDYLLQALPLQQQRGDAWGEAQALHDIASMYMCTGETENALEYSLQALPLWKKVQNRAQEANTLVQIGNIYSALGNREMALAYFQQALSIQESLNDTFGEAGTLTSIGDNQANQRRPEDSLRYLNEALTLYRSGLATDGKRLGEAMVLKSVGAMHLRLKEPDQAISSLNQALELLRNAGHSTEDEASVLYELARAERAANHLPEALAQTRAALDLTESLRSTVAGADGRISYLARVRGRYELLIALLMQLHREHPDKGFDAQALEASERAHARGLLDLLNESRANIRQGVAPELLDKEQSLQASLSFKAAYRLQLLSQAHKERQAADLEKEISALTSEYGELESQIRLHSPHYASLTQPKPLPLNQIQHLLDPETALLEYSLGEEASYLWVVTPDSLHSYILPGRAEIEILARHAYEELSVNNIAAGQKAIASLGRMLLSQAVDRQPARRLLIVADGALQYISFAALRAHGATPVIAEYEIVHLPSASALGALRHEIAQRVPAPLQVAVFADPVFRSDDPRVLDASRKSGPFQAQNLERSVRDAGLLQLDRLPASRDEARAIYTLAGEGMGFQALDFAANRTTATSTEIERYRIVHFASHTLMNSRHPELSGIVLSLVDPKGQPQDGFLQVHEIFNLKLNADLVVLSACQTALGKEIHGEGLIGLTRAFMYAGAPRVVSSLWRVPDQATAELMRQFYRNMLANHLPPAAALRKAQLSLARRPQWGQPYYWAGFVLQGEWK